MVLFGKHPLYYKSRIVIEWQNYYIVFMFFPQQLNRFLQYLKTVLYSNTAYSIRRDVSTQHNVPLLYNKLHAVFFKLSPINCHTNGTVGLRTRAKKNYFYVVFPQAATPFSLAFTLNILSRPSYKCIFDLLDIFKSRVFSASKIHIRSAFLCVLSCYRSLTPLSLIVFSFCTIRLPSPPSDWHIQKFCNIKNIKSPNA